MFFEKILLINLFPSIPFLSLNISEQKLRNGTQVFFLFSSVPVSFCKNDYYLRRLSEG